MNLQLALDRLTEAQCLEIVSETEPYIDWIEIGTGVIKEYGMSIVSKMREAYPHKIIVADMKTCDAGRHEAVQAFKAGADITTVMAFSADKTIVDTLEVAKHYNKRVMIDLLGITQPKRMIELRDLGVDLVSLHFGKDMQTQGEFQTDSFSLVKDLPQFEVAVAGGINLITLPAILEKKPNTIIVGGSITNADNRNEMARYLKGMIREYEIHHK
ncbi:3-hexulose-6-phosphate synthase [Tepidibacillus marianensis]|uniref:3-hexulose-6-phosphate synthase n=1 Tax=Tepidibacillus marianensis TaxID=3131995 RepID=UPI0030CB131C